MTRSSRIMLTAALFALPWLTGVAGADTKPAEQVFKNIQVLKGISVDDFMGTMGVMSAALGFDCSECHVGAGTEKVDWAADTPRKLIARRMVTMMTNINKANFSGRQMVTCWSCHRGRDRPATTPAIDVVYGPGTQEMDDALTQVSGQPMPDEVLTKYYKAIGGADRVAAIKSYVAKGTSVGFGGFGGGGAVQIYAKAPDLHATFIEFPDDPDRGNSIRTYNGKEAWLKTPLTVLGGYQLSGAELDGARVDAQLAFPGQIKQVLNNLRTSLPITISEVPGPSSQTSQEAGAAAATQERLANVVQGTTPQGSLVSLYFDKETGLLLRIVRYGKGPIGRVPTQIDYTDYRDVNGVKMPFRMIFAWLGGRDAIQLTQVQTNVAIDAAKFGRPPDSKER